MFTISTEELLGIKSEPDRAVGENKVSFDKLANHIAIPRSVDGDFALLTERAPFFGKAKWQEKIAKAPLIYAGVIEANNDLFHPGKEEYLSAVLLFAEDEAHQRNISWLSQTMAKIDEVRESDNVPIDARTFIEKLRDEDSAFCMELPSSLSGGAKAWTTVYKFNKQTDLPRSFMPDGRILPFLLVSAKDAWNDGIKLISAAFYIE